MQLQKIYFHKRNMLPPPFFRFASNINNLCRGQQSILNSIICIISYEADKVNGFLLLRAFRSLTLHIKAMIDRILSLKTQKNEDSAQTKRCT